MALSHFFNGWNRVGINLLMPWGQRILNGFERVLGRRRLGSRGMDLALAGSRPGLDTNKKLPFGTVTGFLSVLIQDISLRGILKAG